MVQEVLNKVIKQARRIWLECFLLSKKVWHLFLKRVIFDLILLILTALSMVVIHEYYSESLFLGTIAFKALGANAGFLNGHITRKLAFPKVNWKNDKQKMLKILIIVLYAMYIFAWSRGG